MKTTNYRNALKGTMICQFLTDDKEEALRQLLHRARKEERSPIEILQTVTFPRLSGSDILEVIAEVYKADDTPLHIVTGDSSSIVEMDIRPKHIMKGVLQNV